MADWFCKPKTESLFSLRSETPPPPPEATVDVAPEPSFYLEPDRIAGLGPNPPTPQDELVTIFLSSMAGFIMKRCSTEDCMKRIDIIKPPPPPPVVEPSDDDLEPEPTLEVAKTWEKKKSTLKFAKRKSKMGGGGGGGKPPQVRKQSEHRILEPEPDRDSGDQRLSISAEKRISRHDPPPGVVESRAEQEVEEEEEEEKKKEETEEIETSKAGFTWDGRGRKQKRRKEISQSDWLIFPG